MEKRSFFERLTGTPASSAERHITPTGSQQTSAPDMPLADEEGQLTVDMWQTPSEIVIQTIVGGVKPDDVDVSISHEMVTIRGKRSNTHTISSTDYFYQELFWGTFSRTILLPQEVDVDNADATMKHGLLTVRLPKLDKTRTQKLKVKNE
ncbi:MAG TPA: Hsp20/alpha crystallin family protein [Candidatus Paceibacterota bacterium]